MNAMIKLTAQQKSSSCAQLGSADRSISTVHGWSGTDRAQHQLLPVAVRNSLLLHLLCPPPQLRRHDLKVRICDSEAFLRIGLPLHLLQHKHVPPSNTDVRRAASKVPPLFHLHIPRGEVVEPDVHLLLVPRRHVDHSRRPPVFLEQVHDLCNERLALVRRHRRPYQDAHRRLEVLGPGLSHVTQRRLQRPLAGQRARLPRPHLLIAQAVPDVLWTRLAVGVAILGVQDVWHAVDCVLLGTALVADVVRVYVADAWTAQQARLRHREDVLAWPADVRVPGCVHPQPSIGREAVYFAAVSSLKV
mmetsp:Transcript_9802/g.29850  ORF Transcript_9802/g.29850 Transcript_9802/m.29850 type:complete len:303 (-) Transcript_9802:1122-2030(-)